MGAFLDKPKTDKHNESGTGNGLRFGLSSMQGWRIEMEDAHCAITQLPRNLSGWSFFAVFDGHAGARVSEICATELLKHIVSSEEFKNIDPEMAPSLLEIQHGIREGFLTLDEKIRSMLDGELRDDKSGSTAVCVLLSPKHIFFANCGDSRALLVRNGKVHHSTIDHKPVNPIEKERIQNAGGSVMIQRVNGSLAVSRAIGDYEYKNVEGKGPTEQLVSPEPEVTVIDRDAGDEMLVLACDGIWDVMTNEDICEFLQHRIRCVDDLTKICNETVDTCLYKGSRDNMSIVLVAFENAPKLNESLEDKDKELDKMIQRLIKEYLIKCNDADLNTTVNYLQSVRDIDWPPGGIQSKRHVIDRVYSESSTRKESERLAKQT